MPPLPDPYTIAALAAPATGGSSLLAGAGLGVAQGVLGLIGQDMANAANSKQADKMNNFQGAMFDRQIDWNREAIGRAENYNREMVGRNEQFQIERQTDQMNFGREMVSNAQQYNTLMSNTSYQRGMADMKAAGLNPILAYGQGGATAPTVSPASSSAPSGATASIGTPGVSPPSGTKANIQDIIGPGIRSAVQGASVLGNLEQLAATVANTRAQNDFIQAGTEATRAQTVLSTARAAESISATDLNRANEIVAGLRGPLTQAQTSSALAQAGLTQRQSDQLDRFGRSGTVGDIASTIETLLRRLITSTQ